MPLQLDYQLVGFDPNSANVANSIRERFLGEETFFASRYAGPMVDRSRKGDYGVARDRLIALKGDRLNPARPVDATPQEGAPSLAQQQPASPPSADPPLGVAAAGSEPKEPGLTRPAEVAAQDEERSASEAEPDAAPQSVTGLAFSAPVLDPSLPAARVYFSVDPMGQKLGTMEPWAPGEEPRFDDAEITASNNANVKLAAVPPVPFPAGEPGSIFEAPVERADLPPLPSDPSIVMKNGMTGGQTVAAKGEVTGEHQRPMTP
ncbi:MAG: hypothetical protein E6G86_19070, partial [Alphaproteobacteria bacterium]